jgi:MFS family permease
MKKLIYSRWYAMALTLAATFLIAGINRMCMPVLFKEISTELHLNLVDVGLVWGVDPLAGVFMSILGGMLADRFGIKRTTFAICALSAVFGALRGVSTDLTGLLVNAFLLGAVGSTIATVGTKATSVWFNDKYLKLTNSLIFMAVFLGQMFATRFSATVFSPLLGGWRNVLFLYAVPVFIVGLLWLTYRGSQPAIAREASSTGAPKLTASLLHVIKIRNVWIIGILLLSIVGAITGINGYLPLYLRGIGWEPSVADSAVTLMLGAALIGTIPVMISSGRSVKSKTAVIISVIAMAICIGLVPFFSGPAAWVFIIATGFLRSIPSVLTAVLVLESREVGQEHAGSAIGLVYAMGMLGAFIFPPLGNSLASINPGMPFIFWGSMLLICLCAFFFQKKQA